MRIDLDGRHVVVTGGSGALGQAVVGMFLEAGARCHVPVTGDGFPSGTAWTGHAGLSGYQGVDLVDEEAVAAFYRSIPQLWASIHLVGGFVARPITETSLAEFRQQMDVNATTCFLCCREAARALLAARGGGRIVNVAARPALAPAPGLSAYAASKAAVAALTRVLAEELKESDILVNAIAPSLFDTPQNRQAMPGADFARWPKTEDLARAIVFLASPENRVTHGAILPAYGLM